jgi:RNA polymerase sigma-70 factor, ECF subfamily
MIRGEGRRAREGRTIAPSPSAHELRQVARARAGDERAYRALYDTAFRLVWAFALRSVRDRAAAEELAARTLRRAFSNLALYDGTESFGVWVIQHAARALRELKPDACPPVGRE